MKIAVVIPSCRDHFPKLVQLLTSLETQTRKPDMVAVSCSSMNEGDPTHLNPFSFPVKLLFSTEKRTAGQNRNIAVSSLPPDIDIISFFDADDVMHPQRLEAIEHAFSQGADVVMHKYTRSDKIPEISPEITYYDKFDLIANKLVRAPSKCATLSHDWRIPIHQSQATIRRYIFEKVRFREDNVVGSDSLFCGEVVSLPGITSQYISNSLSQYYPSKTKGLPA